MDRGELTRLREICLAMPGTTERLSHGTPHWFAGGRNYASYWDNHHGDGRLCFWCAAPVGMQEVLVEADPKRFFRPPYVGHRGWLGVRLDRDPDWSEVAALLGRAYELVTGPARVAGGTGASAPAGGRPARYSAGRPRRQGSR